jgi:hypothetical membrane protein
MEMKVQKGSVFRPETNYYKLAGIILIVAFLQFFMAVNLAETQYPGFNTAKNTLSDLGGSLPPAELAANIFNFSIILAGILAIIAVILILKSGGCRLFSTSLTLMAMGAIGVGLFPGYAGVIHVLFAMMVFIFGSMALLFSYRLGLNIPMVVLSIILGLSTLGITLSLFIWGSGIENFLVALLGSGGTEKFIVYPQIFYLVALGGYMTSRGEDWVRLRFFSQEKV